MASWDSDKRKEPQIGSVYKAANFKNVVDIGPIHDSLRTEDLKAGFEPKCGEILDVQFWTTNGTKLRHAFITFSSSDGATVASKSYTPPGWWSSRKKPQVTRFNYPQDLRIYKPIFQSRQDEETLLPGPSHSVSAPCARDSTSTSPSIAPVYTPVSMYSPEEPSYPLSYGRNKDRSIASLPTGPRKTRPTVATTIKEPSLGAKVACQAFGEACGEKPKEHDQSGGTKAFHCATKSVMRNQLRGHVEEESWDRSSVRPPSDNQANPIGNSMVPPPTDQPGQIYSRKGVDQLHLQVPVDDVPSLETKVAEIKALIEELKTTRETLDEELNELSSKKEKLQDEVAHYAKVKVERPKIHGRTAPVQPSRPRTIPAPSKGAEGATSILSALLLLHSIVVSDNLQ